MRVASPVGHEDTLARLWRAAHAGRLPHALLFEGRAGIGKFMAAQWFALGMLCARGPGEPCGVCGPCRRVSSGHERGNHPDLFLIDPLLEGEERIRVGRIAARSRTGEDDGPEQSLEEFLDLRPLEGERRVVLVRECQRMNTAAQNALLKTLEEPRPGTLLVLETHRPAALLATIRSRCIRIRFEPLVRAACEGVLLSAGFDAAAARDLAQLSEGSPGVALAMAQNGTRELRTQLASLVRGERQALEVAAELEELEGDYAGKTPAARARERARIVLELLQTLVRDAWRLHAGIGPEALPLGELARALADRRDARELAQQGASLAQTRADIERNLAPGPLLERALLTLAEGGPRR